jgi:hypothetical protein
MACSKHFRYGDASHSARATPVVHQRVTKLVLPNALSNHAFDLSSSNPCRKLRQFCGHCLLVIIRSMTGQCTRKAGRTAQQCGQIRLGGNLKRISSCVAGKLRCNSGSKDEEDVWKRT